MRVLMDETCQNVVTGTRVRPTYIRHQMLQSPNFSNNVNQLKPDAHHNFKSFCSFDRSGSLTPGAIKLKLSVGLLRFFWQPSLGFEQTPTASVQETTKSRRTSTGTGATSYGHPQAPKRTETRINWSGVRYTRVELLARYARQTVEHR